MKTGVINLLFFIQNEETRENLNNHLATNDKISCHMTTDLPECLVAASNHTYDVLIADFCDSNLDVSDTIAVLEEASNDLAIMLVTQQSDHLNEIDYLNSGAVSVMRTPLNISLMIARIAAMLKWKTTSAHKGSQIGPFEFDTDAKCLSANHHEDISVTDKEARILQFLLARKGKIVSRTDLLQHVWGYNSSANTHTVETHIYRLRKKIGTVADGKSIIITEAGGYRLAK